MESSVRRTWSSYKCKRREEMATQANSDGSADLLGILHEEEDEEEEVNSLDKGERSQREELHHHLKSILATVVIRQVPSQGLAFQLWPAASSLVSLFDRDPSALFANPILSTPLRILELGSGTGLVGIAAAAVLGARVTLTDLLHVLPNLQFNVQANAQLVASRGGSVEVRQLSWGSHEDAAVLGEGEAFDLVMASDVVYYDTLFDPLLETLRFFVRGEVAFVLAHLRRWKKRDAVFFRKARKTFDVAVVHADPPLNGCRTGVTVYRFTAKHTNCKAELKP